MPSAACPLFHATATAPLTGREPVIGRLRNRLQHRGPGWGRVLLTGPREAGTSRLLDECERLLVTLETRPVLRIRPAHEGAAPLEPLRRALLACLGRARRDDVRERVAALLGESPAVDQLLAWLLDGPLVGAPAPEVQTVRAFVRALGPGGPLLVDDVARLDAASRTLVLGEGEADGVGLLGGATDALGQASESLWPLEPLGEHQVELLLRRWLRHPVTTRRLTPLLHAHAEGWPGAVVRTVRRLGRLGALQETQRGGRIVVWPLPLDRAAPCGADLFVGWAERQPADVRRLLEVAALQGDPDDDHFLARAASVRLRVVTDTRAEVEEVFPAAAGRLFPGAHARDELLDAMAPARRRETIRALHRTWSRRREETAPRAPSRAARLRVALERGDEGAALTALEAFLAAVLPGGRPDPEGRALLARALDVLPGDGEVLARARRVLADATEAGAASSRPPRQVADRVAWHEAMVLRARDEGRRRAVAAHLRRAARLHVAQGGPGAGAEAWRELARVELELDRPEVAYDAEIRAADAHEAAGDEDRALAARQAAAAIALDLALFDRGLELLQACLDDAVRRDVDGAGRAVIHLALARAHHGRGDLKAERHHARAALEGEAAPDVRLAAQARLLAIRLRRGDDLAGRQLEELAGELEAQGLVREAAEARDALAAGRLLESSPEADAQDAAPAARLLLARRHLLEGRHEVGCTALAEIAEEPRAGIDLRVEALARLAHATWRAGDEARAHEAACRADALLEVGRRNRANDEALHHLLETAFEALGEMGRAIRHRHASRLARARP